MRRVLVVAAVVLIGALWLIASSRGGGDGPLPVDGALGSGSERVSIRCGDKALVHPRRCAVIGTSGSGGGIVILVRLRWSSWGKMKARAHGYVLDPERGTRSAVKVLVHGRTLCDDGAFYRSLRLGAHGHTVLKLLMQSCAV